MESVNVLDPGHLNHPFEVWGEDSVLDKPAGQLRPLIGVATVDGETRLSVLVLSILQVIGYFLVCMKGGSDLDYMKLGAGYR